MVPSFVHVDRKPVPFGMETEEWMGRQGDENQSVGREWEERREGNCGWHVKYEEMLIK